MDFQSVDLSSYDYLVIDCGYVDRLIPHADDMVAATIGEEEETGEEGHALMFFMEHNKITYIQGDPDGVVDTLLGLSKKKKLHKLSAVCFREGAYGVNVLEMLMDYHHCGGFGIGVDPYRVASFKTKNGKRILYKGYEEYDTDLHY